MLPKQLKDSQSIKDSQSRLNYFCRVITLSKQKINLVPATLHVMLILVLD